MSNKDKIILDSASITRMQRLDESIAISSANIPTMQLAPSKPTQPTPQSTSNNNAKDKK